MYAIVGLIVSTALIQAGQEASAVDRIGDPLPPGAIQRLGTLRFRHPYLMSLACSPDGRTIVTAGGDSVRLWDSKTGKELRRFGGDLSNVWSAVYSPNGKVIATGSMDRTIRLWNIATGAEIIRWQDHGTNEPEAVFAPDGRTLASAGGDGALRFWNPETGRQIKELRPGIKLVSCPVYSPDGTRLAATCQDQSIRIWAVSSGKEIARFTGQRPVTIAFSKNGDFLACPTNEGLTCWNIATGKAAWSIATAAAGRTACFSPDGRFIAISCRSKSVSNAWQGSLWLCNAADGKKVWSAPVANGWIDHMSFAADDRSLVGAVHWEVCRWDVATGQPIDGPIGHAGEFRCVAYSPDGKKIGTASDDMTVRLWAAEQGSQIRCLPGISFSFSPNGSSVATVGPGSALSVWDLESGRAIKRWNGQAHAPDALSFSPDGHTLASKSWMDPDCYLWNVDTGQKVGRLPDHATGFCLLSYCSSGKLILTATPGSVRLWDAMTHKEIRNLPGNGALAGVPCAAFSPDGEFCRRRLFVWCSNGWRAHTGNRLNPERNAGFSVSAYTRV
jgi:WD40 repeat protein